MQALSICVQILWLRALRHSMFFFQVIFGSVDMIYFKRQKVYDCG